MAVFSLLHHLSIKQQLHGPSTDQRGLFALPGASGLVKDTGCGDVIELSRQITIRLLSFFLSFTRNAFKKSANPVAGPELENHKVLRSDAQNLSLAPF